MKVKDPEKSRNQDWGSSSGAPDRQGFPVQPSKISYSSGIYSHLSESQTDNFGIIAFIPGLPQLSSRHQATKGKVLLFCFAVCLLSLFLILSPWLPALIESILLFFKKNNAEEIVNLFRFPSTFKVVYSLLVVSFIGYLILENKKDIKSKFHNVEKDKKPSLFAASLSGSYLLNTCLFLILVFYGLLFHFVPMEKERTIELVMPFVDNPPQRKEPKEPPKEAKHSAVQNAVNSGRHVKDMPLSPGMNQPKQQSTPQPTVKPSKPAPSTRPSPFSSSQEPSSQKEQSKPAPPSPFRSPPSPKASTNNQNKPLVPSFKPKASDDKPLFTSNDGGPAIPVPMHSGSSSSSSRSGSSSSSYQTAYAGSPGRGPVLPSSPGGFSHGSGVANAGPNNNPNGPVSVAARKDVDYGSYMQDLQRRIQNAWKPSSSVDKGDQVMVSFRIRKDGSLVPGSLSTVQSTNPEAEGSSRQAVFDASPGFRPLPEGSPSEVTVNFTFTRTGARFMGQRKY